MTELILGGIIISLLVGFGWYVRESHREHSKLVNALLAKNSQEYVERTLADHTEIKPEIQTNPDLMRVEDMSDEEFDNHIAQELQ